MSHDSSDIKLLKIILPLLIFRFSVSTNSQYELQYLCMFLVNPPRMIKRVSDQKRLRKHLFERKVCLKRTFCLEVRSIASL